MKYMLLYARVAFVVMTAVEVPVGSATRSQTDFQTAKMDNAFSTALRVFMNVTARVLIVAILITVETTVCLALSLPAEPQAVMGIPVKRCANLVSMHAAEFV